MPEPRSLSPSSTSRIAGARSRRGWYQLEDRHAAMQTGRAVAIGAIAIAAAVAPIDDMSTRDHVLAVAACLAALALHVVLRWVPERWPKRLLAAVDAGLVVDALLVAALALLSGGTDSLALWLLPIFALAATLALSVRTGIKATVLSALVLAGVQAAEGADAPVLETAGPLAMVVAVVVVAGALARVNERELVVQRRREEVLHDASADLVGVDDPERLAGIAEEAAGTLLPGYDVSVRRDGEPATLRAWREDGRAHLEVPITVRARRDGQAEDQPLGAIVASRPIPRVGGRGPLVRRGQVVALDTLATALGVALHRSELVRRLERLSMVDPLTGLGNRRAFDEALAVEFARARRAGGSVSLILLDVDHFKGFNDRHGHQAGDEALIEVARVLQGTARAEDRACRIGGEEFALLLSGAHEGAAAAVAERVRAGVASRELPYGRVTVSLGVASCGGDGDPARLVATADERLYAAKAQGRNRVVAGAPVTGAPSPPSPASSPP